MPAKLLLLGLDGAEPTMFGGGSDGFPTVDSMRRNGAAGPLGSHHDLLTDTVWPEIRTGRSVSRTGIYYQPRQFRSGEAAARKLATDDLDLDSFYWNRAARAGFNVCAVDQPLSPSHPDAGAVEIMEWGTHDRLGYETSRASDSDVVASYGAHPILDCDAMNDGTRSARIRIADGLREGIEKRTALLLELLRARDWDLFTAVFSESHCGGHQLWPSPSRSEGGDDLVDLYRLLDAAVGTLVAAVGSEATVILYASHGMGPVDDGVGLVPEVLGRLGLTAGNRRRRRLSAMVPQRARSKIRGLVGTHVIQRAGFTSDRTFHGSSLALSLPNTRHGAIRLRLEGRDPGGELRPGSFEHRQLTGRIESAFMSLRDADHGHRVVRDVVSVDDELGADRHPDLPDLIIRFRDDVGPIGPCVSSIVGPVSPVVGGHRTGEHGTPGAIWGRGPGIVPGSSIEGASAIDLAPTVLNLLGVNPSHSTDGVPVGALTP